MHKGLCDGKVKVTKSLVQYKINAKVKGQFSPL